MQAIAYFIEEKFTVFSLLFFTNTLGFYSLFSLSEGVGFSIIDPEANPLEPVLSIIQHLIFGFTCFLLLTHWKATAYALSKNTYLIALILVFFSSFLWSDFPEITLRKSFSLVETSFFGVYVGVRYQTKEHLRLLSLALTISIIINVLFIIAFPGSAIESGVHAGAWRGTLEHKNFFSRLMVLTALVFWMQVPKSLKQSIILKVLLLISSILIILSTSKTGLVILIYLLFVTFPICKSLQWSFKTATIFQSIVAVIVGGSTVFFVSQADYVSASLGRDLTLSGRTEIWSASISKLLTERPLLGYGYYGFWHGLDGPSYDVIKAVGINYIVPHSHNGFIELALASGLLGVMLFSLSFVISFRRALIKPSETKSNVGVWSLMYFSFILTSNQTETTLVSHNSIFWVIYVAISVGDSVRRQ